MKIIRILRDCRGQAVMDYIVAILGAATITAIIVAALNAPIGDLHEKAVDGIVNITGSGM